MGTAKIGGHYLKAFYLNLGEFNIEFFKHSSSVAGKLIETKKLPENLFISSPGLYETLINSSVRHYFQQLTYCR